ncbi:protein kinase domain-containing protein [Pseudoxanthomonas dokdonensis]|uniref:Protein kinase domain-containing protein n=1 Tax=Pseudoxanthomonas dokdonensis TaxID=344882 RepID=A0A0R0CET9_9GAMM|nr:tetratricopeptide repeat protein [Pseudoxanthomonas dokdonensis]KRG68300.1 hypothetical protein ABB29_13305 [Pseudoxanthomonas dokdonensis]
MDAARWKRVSPLLDVLLELQADARAARLATLRAQDPELASDVEALLAMEQDNDDFLVAPLIDKPDQHSHTGTRVGPYQLETLLGEGGMGMVWLASRADGLYQRRVALKLLRPGLADPNLRLRFSREREILARLEHPNIARLLDAGIDERGQPYLALEYAEGLPINEYAREHGLSIDERLALFAQVCEAVSHAHANLIVHRDLKPSNILVTASGEVRLLDFGIAKLLDDDDAPPPLHPRTEIRAFTLHYAAPEQIRGELVTTRTDVYSLGVVLYELLSRAKPYRLRRQTDAEWEEAILAVDPLRPSLAIQRNPDGSANTSVYVRRDARRLRGDLDNIILKALAKAPVHRYPSVEALARDIQQHLQGRPVQARSQSLGYRMVKYVSRHRVVILFGSLVALALLGALLVSVWQGEQTRREAQRAQAMQRFMIGLFDNAGVAQRGRLYDARALLQAGEARGAAELARQPLTHAELMGTIARLHLGLGDYREAQALLQKQQALLQSLSSVPPRLRLESLTMRARALNLLGRSGECTQLLAREVPAWEALQAQLPAHVASLLTAVGRCQRSNGDFQGAREHFQQSHKLRVQLQDHAGVAENLWNLASLDQDQGNLDEAWRGYQGALSYLGQHVPERTPVSIDIERSIAVLQRDRGEVAAARASLQRALTLSREVHGADHPVTLELRRQLASLQADVGEYRLAQQALREIQASTLAAMGPGHPQTAAGWNALGMIAWQLGEQERALQLMARAVRTWRTPDGRRQLPGGLFNYAMVLHDAGRQDEALAALNEARQLRARQYGASHPLVGDTDRLIGEVLAAQGKLDAADAYFQRAVALTRVGYGPDHPRSLYARLSAALQWQRQGKAVSALQELNRLAAQQGQGSEYDQLRWLARAHADAIRCRGSHRDLALRDLQTLDATLHIARADGGVIPRRIASLREQCLSPPLSTTAIQR